LLPWRSVVSELFRKFAQRSSDAVGSSRAFVVAVLVVVAWAISGPAFHYSDSWQLVINTGTTIVTFLMVFLIQNAQNRDAKALHLKLDELIRGMAGARNRMIELQDLTDQELDELQAEFARLRQSERRESRREESDAAPRRFPAPARRPEALVKYSTEKGKQQ
jgi:low affinity Fe/Cu permease